MWPSAVAATAISSTPKVASGRGARVLRRPQNQPPDAIPVKKMAIASAAACAVLPTIRPSSRTQSTW